ncbi:hypothetical protein ACKGJI_11290 [Sulfurospirillum sp. 1307]
MKFLYTCIITITALLSQLHASEMMDFVQRTDVQYQKSASIENKDGVLILNGGSWTNAKNKGSGYDGNGVESVKGHNFIGTYVGIKFAVRAGGKYSSFSLSPKGFKGAMTYTTHSTWAKSKLISENNYRYQTLNIDKDGNWVLKLSKNGYNKKVLYTKKGKLSKKEKESLKNAKLLFTFGDNYAGEKSRLTIYEVQLEK